MELYIDTADTALWKNFMPTGGLFKGITTNPLLAHRAGLAYPKIDWGGDMTSLASDLGAKELHCQVYGPVEALLTGRARVMKTARRPAYRS